MNINLPEDPAFEQEIIKALDRRRIDFYTPYAKQQLFHASGNLPAFPGATSLMEERLLMAGNQLGKCATFQALIEHPDGSRSTFGERYRDGKPFEVWGWDGKKVVRTWAVTPIKKPAEPCVRLWFADGRWFECARRHRVMLATGEYVFCDSLLASLPTLQESSSESCLSVRGVNVPRWYRIQRGWLAGCLASLRLCDGQLLRVTNSVRSWLRPPVGVRPCNYSMSGVGACSSKYTNSFLQQSDRLSNPDGVDRFVDRCVAFVDRVVCRFARRMTCCIQAAQRQLLASLVPLRSTLLNGQDQSSQEASVVPFSIDGNRIVAYETIPCQEVYDFTVPETSNYVTGGFVHHNTLCAGGETSFHLTGNYPSWWQGRRFPQNTSCWVAGPTSQMTRDNPQKMLMGEPGEWGSGMIPGRLITNIKRATHGVADSIESVQVLHEPTGKTSRILFKSYDQGRIRWQGSTIDFIWCDEEPPEEIYGEAMVRVQVKKGFIMMTFTPLLGMSAVVTRLYKTKPPASIVIKMGINDAGHYTEEERKLRISKYPEHEREARANGEPVLGSGKVFPVDEKMIIESPIQIPSFWPRIAGLDIGWEHPTAAVWLAWDRDTDVVHIYDTHRLNQQTPVVHAAAMKRRGDWIPFAWPHDGLQHDTGSGKVIADQYRTEGVKMLPTHATHPPQKGKKEGTGGYGLEAGILDMLSRFQTGRLRVSSLLGEWLDEYRTYYRKDGLIVKEGDDLMSATRIGIMSLRFAKCRVERETSPSLPQFRMSDPTMGPLG